MSKPCSCCDSKAELSLCFLASTIGRPNRLQKCSEGTAVCKACMQDLLSKLATVMPGSIFARLIAAYTAIGSHSDKDDAGGKSARLSPR